MMLRTLYVLPIFCASLAHAAPQIPDSGKVKSITQAANLCELGKAGIDWTEKSPTVLALMLSEADMTPPSAKMDRLKECIFAWAYDRKVTLEISMKP